MNTNENVIICKECGCVIEGGDYAVVDGETYCLDCVERLGFVQCDECGEWFDPAHEDMIEWNDKTICESCRDSLGLVQCDECGEWGKSYDLTTVYGGWRNSDLCVCDNCLNDLVDNDRAFYCDDCEDYYLSQSYDRYYAANGWTVCEGCYSDHWVTCRDCGDVIYEDDAFYDERHEGYYCESCYNSRRSNINSYSYRPGPIFHGLGHSGRPVYGDPITIGFELEVDGGDDEDGCSCEIADAFSYDTLYMKEDSSVTFEIVTHPHTLAAYKSELDLETLCEIPKSYGFSSHSANTCGLHMHVGRDQLGETDADENSTIVKIVLLMYRHWDSLVKFSRRADYQLSRWAAKPDLPLNPRVSYSPENLVTLVNDYYRHKGRYMALNLENRGTIEFRLWRGTLKPSTILATLQLTSNIVGYAMAHTIEDVASSAWEDLTGYEPSEELTTYLEERGLVAGEIPVSIPIGEPAESIAADTEFHVGDKVAIVQGSGLVHNRTVGSTGTITHVHPDFRNGDTGYLIRFDPETTDSFVYTNYAHDGGGRDPEGHSYWATADSLALLEAAPCLEGFRIGDRVMHTNPAENPFGYTGTVTSVDNEINSLGVVLDGFVGGHDLLMRLTGNNRHAGWWCSPADLAHTA